MSPLEGAETPGFVLAEHLVERLGRTDRADDLVGTGAPGLITDQDGLEPERLVADQARSGQEDLSTGQATKPSGRMSTAQAAKPSGSLVTDQAPVTVNRDDVGRKIVAFCDVPRSMVQIMGELGLAHRTFFRRNQLEPLLAGGVPCMTHPDQAYVLTKTKAALEARRVKGDARTGNGGGRMAHSKPLISRLRHTPRRPVWP